MFNAIKEYFKATTTKSISFNYKWTIENFSRLYDEGYPWKWRIFSDEFAPPVNELFRFELYLYPKSNRETDKEYVAVSVGVKAIPQKYDGKIRCQWIVSIVDENGHKRGTKDSELYQLFCKQVYVETAFIQHSSLLNCTSQLPNSNLTLHYEIHLQADSSIFNVIPNNEVGTSRFDCAQKVTKVVHTWTVENFADLFDSSKVIPFFIKSDNFPALSKQSELFYLQLYPNHHNRKTDKNLAIAIRNVTKKIAIAHWRISLFDVDDEECYTQESAGNIKSSCAVSFEFNRDYLLNKSSGLFYENKIRVYSEISYMTEDKEKAMNHSEMSEIVHKSESSFDIAQKVIHHVSHQWTIDNFSDVCLKATKNHTINSEIFEPQTDPRFSFHLRLWPNEQDEKIKDYVPLDLCNASHDIKIVTFQYRVSILAANGDKWTRLANQNTIEDTDMVRDSKFFPQTIFQTPFLANQYLPKGTLTIICELWIIQDRKICKIIPTNTQSQVNNPSSSSAVLNMPDANLKEVVINIESVSSVGGFKVNSSFNDEKNQ